MWAPKYERVTLNSSYIRAMEKYCGFLDSKEVTYIISEDTATQLGFPASYCYEFDITNTAYFMDTLHLSSEGRKNFSDIIH